MHIFLKNRAFRQLTVNEWISSFGDTIFYLAFINPNHSYLSQLDVTYKTPDLMSHFLPPHEVSFTFCCS
ncbi:hypothetical protein, partial [Streptococcus pneumoniae]